MGRVWNITRYPNGDAFSQSLELVERPVDSVDDGHVLVRNLYLSLDPGQRTWMRAEGSYMAPLALGEPMPGGILGMVLESRSRHFVPGDLVSGMGWWGEQSLIDARALRKILPDPEIPALAHMSVLGPTGWTAHIGMVDIGRPQPGNTLVVSAAAGAVGSCAGQIGRIKGCRVIGIAGSPAKCRWLVDELGFDGAIDYLAEDVGQRLRELCPAGVDIYFDNVGGKVSAAVYPLLADFGRVVLCGLASTYNGGTGPTIDLSSLLMKRARIEAFVVTDHFRRIPVIVAEMREWLLDGRLKYRIDLIEGIENAVTGLTSLLRSGDAHMGKMLVRLADAKADGLEPDSRFCLSESD